MAESHDGSLSFCWGRMSYVISAYISLTKENQISKLADTDSESIVLL